MPEIKSAGGFTAAPEAKPLSPTELKKAFDTQMGKAAVALGGALINPEEPGKAPKVEYTFPVEDEDKKRYIRSLLGKENFIKTYSLFGGNLSVSFKTRTAKQAESLRDVDEKDRYKAKLMCSLNKTLIGKEELATNDLSPLDDVAYSAVCKAFNEFEELCDEMYRRANDPDFWTGTGGRA